MELFKPSMVSVAVKNGSYELNVLHKTSIHVKKMTSYKAFCLADKSQICSETTVTSTRRTQSVRKTRAVAYKFDVKVPIMVLYVLAQSRISFSVN